MRNMEAHAVPRTSGSRPRRRRDRPPPRRGTTTNRTGSSGPTPARRDGKDGTVVRAFHPDAVACELLLDGAPTGMEPLGAGLYAASSRAGCPRFRIDFASASTAAASSSATTPTASSPRSGRWTCTSSTRGPTAASGRCWAPTSAPSTGSDGDGVLRLGSERRPRVARRRFLPRGTAACSRCAGSAGRACSSCSCPASAKAPSTSSRSRRARVALRLKTDPMARAMEVPPLEASRVDASRHPWNDAAWMSARDTTDPTTRPLAAYEVHLGSWARVPEDGNRLADLSRDRAQARGPRQAPGVHPRRADAGRRAPVHRIVGVPGVGLLRADLPLRHARTTSASSSTTATKTASA